MTRAHSKVEREDSLAARVRAVASRKDTVHAEHATWREEKRLDRLAERYFGPPPVDRRGAFGAAAGRAAYVLRIPPMVTTSAQLCSVYPFVTSSGINADGWHVGMDVYSRTGFAFSLHEFYRAGVITAPNMVVTGEIGSAKSSLLKTIAFREQVFGTRFYVTDVKGEYDDLARLSGITPMAVGPGKNMVMNPLAGLARDSAMPEESWLALQRARRLLLVEGLLEIQLGEKLLEAEKSLLEYAIDATSRLTDGTDVARMPTPTLSTVLAAMSNPALWQDRLAAVNYPLNDFVSDSRRVRLALERLIAGSLGGIFDGPTDTSARLDFTQPGTILNLKDIRTSDQMTAMAMTCAQSWLESELSRPDAPPRICFYDEFALIASHLPLVRRMREQLKLARALGIANVLAFHRFSDLAAAGDEGSETVRITRGLIEDTGVRVSYRQAAGSLVQAQEFLGTTDVETDILRYLRRGVALWKIGNESAVIKHQLSSREMVMVDTDSRMEFVPGIDSLSEEDYEARISAAMTSSP